MSWAATHCVLDAQSVRRSLSEVGVVVIEGVALKDDDFVDFLVQLGPLTFTQGETPLLGQPALNIVTNVNRKTPPNAVALLF